ncbi:hypothetical protein RFI_10498 [Reticulomyxa filosa]|uniref:Uncharacterized protein n=1 Tax=Reticulomyxa filosa TaxID=46433 RepID=X6NKW2_RETFI|nr:hypothetical protein RFI_10498 [Reticulomyxa filosa]|eukprot:ETO26636.1 hypothetical protein RFI_10498 [Reticulomyxa filosa]
MCYSNIFLLQTMCSVDWLKGVFLNEEDLNILNQMVTDVITYGILPFAEKRIHDLYIVVAQERKSLSQTFRRLFSGKKPKPETQQRRLERSKSMAVANSSTSNSNSNSNSNSSSSGRYTSTIGGSTSNVLSITTGGGGAHAMASQFSSSSSNSNDMSMIEDEAPFYGLDSIESAIRQLADLSFIMQQYELALEHYKLAINDYKSDGAKNYLAGAFEMAALCAALLSKAMATPSWMSFRTLPDEPSTLSTGNIYVYTFIFSLPFFLFICDIQTTSHIQQTNKCISHKGAYNSNRKDMETFFDAAFNEYVEIS